MAQMIERQLTHRAAARSVSGMAAGARARDQEPAVGHQGRRPVARTEPLGRGPGAEPAHLLRDRAHPQSRGPHGGVRRRAPARPRSRSISMTCSNHVRRLTESGFGRGVRFVDDYRSVAAARARKSRQAGAGIPEPAQECRRGHRRASASRIAGRIVLHDGVPPRRAGSPSRAAARASTCLS